MAMATANSLSFQGAPRLCVLALALVKVIPGHHRLPHTPNWPAIIMASLDISVPMPKSMSPTRLMSMLQTGVPLEMTLPFLFHRRGHFKPSVLINSLFLGTGRCL
jgi:hypothetical protein